MSFYAGEEEVYKCSKHPSKRRRIGGGICPTCLRDRLIVLCPNCHDVRPCSCNVIASTSYSSPFSLFPSSGRGGSARSSNAGAFSGDPNLKMETEPSFTRSRSLAIPIIRTKIAVSDSCGGTPAKSKAALWWAFIKQNRRKTEDDCDDQSLMMIRRSQSSRSPGGGGGDEKSSPRKNRGWKFSGGINMFGGRQSKTSKVVQEGRPLH
ncbi:uncharacterized protein LOC124924268 [Impatiens glandulifera]|uniref:uncharacterized protein LOC124924268 n=1 Tax=Impatiens glandulifera TaxID=253017 RepID=UPI001FB06E85|nr:uncharacterized protein LOC124924268 [Impatiens glandulifera]